MIDNEKKFAYLGITKFHNAGYKGQNIIIADRENIKSKHGAMVAEVLSMIAPKVEIILHQLYIDNFNADIYTTSLFSLSDNYERYYKKAQELNNRNIFLCCAVRE